MPDLTLQSTPSMVPTMETSPVAIPSPQSTENAYISLYGKPADLLAFWQADSLQGESVTRRNFMFSDEVASRVREIRTMIRAFRRGYRPGSIKWSDAVKSAVRVNHETEGSGPEVFEPTPESVIEHAKLFYPAEIVEMLTESLTTARKNIKIAELRAALAAAGLTADDVK